MDGANVFWKLLVKRGSGVTGLSIWMGLGSDRDPVRGVCICWLAVNEGVEGGVEGGPSSHDLCI